MTAAEYLEAISNTPLTERAIAIVLIRRRNAGQLAANLSFNVAREQKLAARQLEAKYTHLLRVLEARRARYS